mmetsp:Transcript_10749/g.16490  ORF Transcript_10749/g.16490 Transcript_10749/m.16490 type:complete len:652 (-) Transcript_10749:208-2163(-)
MAGTNRVRTACAIVIQSSIRRLLAIRTVQKLCEERGMDPSFSARLAYEVGQAYTHPSRVQHIAALIIQINFRLYFNKMEVGCIHEKARLMRVGSIPSGYAKIEKKSATRLYSGRIPAALIKDDMISESTTLDTTLDTTFDESLPSDESVKCDEWEGRVQVQRKQVRIGSERFPDAKTMALIAARWQPEKVTSKELEALVTIQCFARVICANEKALALLDECLEKEEEEAAIILQCWLRQLLAQWKLLALRNGSSRNLMTERQAVITLQCFARVLSANKKALLLLDEVLDKEEETACLVIQRWFRQLLEGRGIRVASIINDKDKDIAIGKIQATARQFLASAEYQKQIDAAIVLQCFIRVLAANQKAALLLDELLEQEEEKAAIVLQRWIRQSLSPENTHSKTLVKGSSEFMVSLQKQRRSSSEKEQRAADECWSSIGSSTTKSIGLVRTIAKGQMGDKDVTGAGSGSTSQLDVLQSSLFRVVEPQEAVRTRAEVEEAVITLQCFARVIAANAKAAALLDELLEREEEKAAIIIQCWIRQYRARQAFSFLSRVDASCRGDAAIRIQSIVRCYLARKTNRATVPPQTSVSAKRTILKNKFEEPENSKLSYKHEQHAHRKEQSKQTQSIKPAKRIKKEPWWGIFFSCFRPQAAE